MKATKRDSSKLKWSIWIGLTVIALIIGSQYEEVRNIYSTMSDFVSIFAPIIIAVTTFYLWKINSQLTKLQAEHNNLQRNHSKNQLMIYKFQVYKTNLNHLNNLLEKHHRTPLGNKKLDEIEQTAKWLDSEMNEILKQAKNIPNQLSKED